MHQKNNYSSKKNNLNYNIMASRHVNRIPEMKKNCDKSVIKNHVRRNELCVKLWGKGK